MGERERQKEGEGVAAAAPWNRPAATAAATAATAAAAAATAAATATHTTATHTATYTQLALMNFSQEAGALLWGWAGQLAGDGDPYYREPHRWEQRHTTAAAKHPPVCSYALLPGEQRHTTAAAKHPGDYRPDCGPPPLICRHFAPARRGSSR